jgi:formylglycine-generating enzyme required for sulfatase activity
VRTIRPDLPPNVERALTAALAKTPADRPATARQFVALLAHPVGRPAERVRRWAWIGGAAAIAIVGALVWWALGARDRLPMPPAPAGPPPGLVLVPAGEYPVGGAAGRAQRRVRLDSFYLDSTEVTVAAYGRYLAATARPAPWRTVSDSAWPVTAVLWTEADAYCRWRDTLGRLPSEAEWEAAARGPTGRRYPWGDAWAPGRANADSIAGTLAPPATFPLGRSWVGAVDLVGNAWEWTATTDSGPGGLRHVIKGGGFDSPPENALPAFRAVLPDDRARAGHLASRWRARRDRSAAPPRMTRSALPVLALATLLGCQPSARRVLVLDLALSDPALIAGTAAPWTAAGYAVDYRPRHPHLTRADLPRYGVVVLLGGLTPERWSDALSGGDLALLTEWVPRGGVLVFGYAGDGDGGLDRWVMNRWLAAMGAGIAIGADVLQDTGSTATGAHGTHPTARAVPGAFDHSGLAPFPAGRNHALSVRAPAQALARAPATAFVQRPGTDVLSRGNAPVVAASRVVQGLVVVASRHLLGAVGSEVRAVAASPLVRDSLAATHRFLVALARWTRHPAEWATIPPATGARHPRHATAPRRDAPLAPSQRRDRRLLGAMSERLRAPGLPDYRARDLSTAPSPPDRCRRFRSPRRRGPTCWPPGQALRHHRPLPQPPSAISPAGRRTARRDEHPVVPRAAAGRAGAAVPAR